MHPDESHHALRLACLRWGDDKGIPRHSCGRRLRQVPSSPRCFACYPCGFRKSVTAGTTLAHCKLPLAKVLTAAKDLAEEAERPSARALARKLRVHVETAWNLRHRLISVVTAVDHEASGHLRIAKAKIPVHPPVPNHPPLPPDATLNQQKRQYARQVEVHVVRGQRGEGAPATVCMDKLDDELTRHHEGMVPVTVPPTPQDRHILDDLEHHVRNVFFGVTGRWLPRYAQFAAKRTWVLGRYPTQALLGLLMDAPAAPFDQLRPGAWLRLDAAAGLRTYRVAVCPAAWERAYPPLVLRFL
jgi:transposase-like protein